MMMKNMQASRKAGMTLIEVMVAMLLLAILVIGGASVMTKAGGGVQEQQNKREALVSADAIMERFWNLSYPELQAYGGSTISTNALVNGVSRDVVVDIGNEALDADTNAYVEVSVTINHSNHADDDVYVTRRYEFGINRAAL